MLFCLKQSWMYFDALRQTLVGNYSWAILTDSYFYWHCSWPGYRCTPKALQKKQNLYVLWFPASSVIHAGLHFPGHPNCVFSLHRVFPVFWRYQYWCITLSSRHHSYGTRNISFAMWRFYFGKESPTYQVELKNKYPTKALLLIAEQNPECVIGSAFCLIIKDEDVRFSVNMDSLSRSGVRVSPDVLMLARNNKHG